jgi:LytS/YehU family sensor histidine kinase
MLLLAPAVYVNKISVLPFLRKNFTIFLLLFIGNALLFTGVSVFFICKFSEQTFHLKMFVNFFGIMVLALSFASAIKMARDSYMRRQHEKEAELKLLKAQLNPHFLFNTLNNLYGLSVSKSDKLPDLMLKLSNLLRYSLYETKEVMVPLEKEIQYLENYIALEKIRLEDQTEIVFENKVKDATIKIAPMLLIVFVENAFKHLDISEDKKSSVYVSIEENANQLLFKCINTSDSSTFKEDDLEKGRSGIGLINVKKRLSLIYPENHQLTITKNDTSYSIELILDL